MKRKPVFYLVSQSGLWEFGSIEAAKEKIDKYTRPGNGHLELVLTYPDGTELSGTAWHLFEAIAAKENADA